MAHLSLVRWWTFARSVAGQVADYQWSDTTDDKGQARVEIGTGYYQARASIDEREIGSWSSIPINGGYEGDAQFAHWWAGACDGFTQADTAS